MMKPFRINASRLLTVGFMLCGAVGARAQTVDLFYEYFPLGPGLVPMGRSTDVDTARYAGPLQIRPAQDAARTVDDCFIDSLGVVILAESGEPRSLQAGDTLAIPFQPDNMAIVSGSDLHVQAPLETVFTGGAVHLALERGNQIRYSLRNAHLNAYHHFSQVIAWAKKQDHSRCFDREFVKIQIDYAGNNPGTRFNCNVEPQVFELYRPMGAALYSDVIYHEYGHFIHNNSVTKYFFRDKVLRGTVSAGISEALCDATAYTLNATRDSTYLLAEGYPEITIDFRGITRMNDQMQDELRDVFVAMLVRLRRTVGAAHFDPLLMRMMAESKIFVNRRIEKYGALQTRNYSLLLTDMAQWLYRADWNLYGMAYEATITDILYDMHLIPPGIPALRVESLCDSIDAASEHGERRAVLRFPVIPGASHFVLHWKFYDLGWADARNVHGFVPTRQLLIKRLSERALLQSERLYVDEFYDNGVYDAYMHMYQIVEDPRDVLFRDDPDQNYYRNPWVEIVSQSIEAGEQVITLHFPPWWGDAALHEFKLGAVWEGSKEPGWSVLCPCLLQGGGVELSAVHTDAGHGPERIDLHPNYPNPFNPETTLQYTLNRSAYVLLCVYDMRGRLVRRLAQGRQAQGLHEACWDGKRSDGTAASSGMYVARLRVGQTVRQIKMLLLR